MNILSADKFKCITFTFAERVIAMSFPSYGKMSLYRNPIKVIHYFSKLLLLLLF